MDLYYVTHRSLWLDGKIILHTVLSVLVKKRRRFNQQRHSEGVTRMSVLITGGAGYIGSHVNKLLTQNGYDTIVYDNLLGGHREVLRWGRFVQGDIGNEALLDQTLRDHAISAVFHFASYLNVSESVLSPAKYYHNNVVNTFRLLESHAPQ